MAELHEYRQVPTHPISKRTDGSSSEHHKPHANTEEYEKLYKESIEDPTGFWDRVSHTLTYYLLAPRAAGMEGKGRRRGKRILEV